MMKPSDKNTTQVMTILDDYALGKTLRSEALAAFSQLIDEAIGPDDRDYSQDNTDERSKLILVATSKACNELRAEIRNNLRAKGLI